MNLNQIANLFSEVVKKCPELDGKNFVIMKPDLPAPMATEGYELVIRKDGKGDLSEETKKKIEDLAQERGLSVESKETSVMIFKASPKSERPGER